MAYPFFSTAWAEDFKQRWNTNEGATGGTGDLAGVLELTVATEEHPPLQLRITEDGTLAYAGPALEGERPRFRFIATMDGWRKLGSGEYSVIRSLRGPIYMQGSMLTLLGSFEGLCAAFSEVPNVPTEEWA